MHHSFINSAGRGHLLRGAAMVLAGILLLHAAGCGGSGLLPHRHGAGRDDNGDTTPRVVCSGVHGTMKQARTQQHPSPREGWEYVFIPLTLELPAGNSVVFSSLACVNAYAVPGGQDCTPSQREARQYGREHIPGFTVFDGILYAGREQKGWLAFEVPCGTRSVHVDFRTGMQEGDCLSFDCPLDREADSHGDVNQG